MCLQIFDALLDSIEGVFLAQLSVHTGIGRGPELAGNVSKEPSLLLRMRFRCIDPDMLTLPDLLDELTDVVLVVPGDQDGFAGFFKDKRVVILHLLLDFCEHGLYGVLGLSFPWDHGRCQRRFLRDSYEMSHEDCVFGQV